MPASGTAASSRLTEIVLIVLATLGRDVRAAHLFGALMLLRPSAAAKQAAQR